MRGCRWLLLLLVVSTVGLSGHEAGEPRSGGEVTLVLRGLVALQTTETGLSVLFLSPPSDPHAPTLSVDLAKLTGPPGALPSMTIPDELGRGIAAWRFEELALEASNVEEASILETPGEVKDAATDTDKTRIRWIPHMADIYGSPQKLSAPDSLVAARGTFKAGRLEPLFDGSKNKAQKFTIGARACTAIADGARLQVRMKDSRLPLLTFKAGGESGSIAVHPGTTIALAALPQNQPHGDLVHFHHYYELLPGVEAKMPTACTGAQAPGQARQPAEAPPTGFPVRCAPIKFP